MDEFYPNLWLNVVDLPRFKVRGALIIGKERVLIWDTLSHPRDMAPYNPLIKGKDLFVVYSHADWDHIWGTTGLAKPCRLVFGHQNCLERFIKDVPQTLKEKQAAAPKIWDEVKLVAPTLTFLTELKVDLGEVSLSLHSLPGHTADTIVGFIPEKGILLGGDAFETPFPVLNNDSPVKEWIENLSRWEEDKRVKTVIPAHGTIGGSEIILSNIQYLKDLLDGKKMNIPYPLESFYEETHQSNLRIVGRNP